MEANIQVSELYQVAEVELVYRSKVNASKRPAIRCSKDCFEILLKAWNQDTIELLEEFKVVFLTRANRVLGIYNLSSGGTAGTVCDVKLVFAAALKCNASAIILSHNHPSGRLKPSEADIQMTKTLKQAGEILDINVIDHLIVTKEGFYAFSDEGMM